MSRKLTFAQAAKIMKTAKLEPLEDYPGTKEKWKCKCLQCGKTVYPSFGSVRNGQGGCRECGMKRGTSSRRLDEKMAVEVMKQAGVVPVEPYVSSSKPWRSKCKKCKREVSPTFGNVKNGHAACVYCAGKKVHPDDAVKIMKKAGLEPLAPYPGSNTRWKCRHITCGEIVFPTQSSIVQGGGGCKKCGDVKTREKQMLSDKEARELFLKNGLEPQVPYPGAGKPWKSKCRKCKQIVSPTYSSIKSGTGCGVCGGKIVTEELAVKVMKKARLKPLVPYPGAKKNWKCECLKCGETVFPNYGDVNQGDGGCKYCAKHFVRPEDAVALMLASNIQPLEPYRSSGVPWKSICLKCNKNISPHYNSVRSRGSGCKYCAKLFVDAEDAITAMRKAKLEPLAPYPGSQKPWLCRCLRCGQEVNPAYTSIQAGGKGCVYCGGKKVDPDKAFAFMQSRGLEPLEPYKRADGPWRCRCIKCLKIVTPSYSSIGQGQSGCVYCGGKKVDPVDAISLFLENNLRPLVPYKSTATKWKSECMKCKRIVHPTHHMVSQRSGGCKYCATNGFDFNLPAYLYLITHDELGAHKIGISGEFAKEDRLYSHTKQGWKVYRKMNFNSADQTYEIEQAVLLWLREAKGLQPFLSLSEMPQRGWTETVNASEIDLPSIWAKVEELSRVKR